MDQTTWILKHLLLLLLERVVHFLGDVVSQIVEVQGLLVRIVELTSIGNSPGLVGVLGAGAVVALVQIRLGALGDVRMERAADQVRILMLQHPLLQLLVVFLKVKKNLPSACSSKCLKCPLQAFFWLLF